MRSHDAANFSDFFGYFNRGDFNSVPATHALRNLNRAFDHFTDKTRPGIRFYKGSLGLASIARMRLYQRTDEDRYVLLDGNGNFTDSAFPGAPFLSIPGCEDFWLLSLYNRAYITPLVITGGFQQPMPGQNLKVWDGAGLIRDAGGLKPVGPTFAAATGTAGKVTKGRHIISVSYETASGFITKPGPAILYKAPGKKKINLTNIPTGPAGTVGRRILMTKMIPKYDGNPSHYELFFCPDGNIQDNVTTTLTINDLDSELIDSADYLQDIFETIAAPLGMCDYQGSMVIWGQIGFESIARVSVNGNPETMSSTDGFCILAPADGGGVRRCFEYRGSLYSTKLNRTLVTRANGDVPTTWSVAYVDSAYGSDLEGVSSVLDSFGTTKDAMVIVNNTGALLFYGRYSDRPISWKIDEIWPDFYNNVGQVAIDTKVKRAYIVGFPIDGSSNNVLLVGDFANADSPDDIRWSVWNFSNEAFDISSIVVSAVPSSMLGLKLVFVQDPFEIFTLDENLTYDLIDPAEPTIKFAIESRTRFPYVFDEKSGNLMHFTGWRGQILGSGILQSFAYGIDDTIQLTFAQETLSSAPGSLVTKLSNLLSEKCSIELYQNDQGNLGHFSVNMFDVFYRPAYRSRKIS